MQGVKGTSPHGNSSTYESGCRCDDCREAKNAKERERRKFHSDLRRDFQKRYPTSRYKSVYATHGTTTGYKLFSCRCYECSEAASASTR